MKEYKIWDTQSKTYILEVYTTARKASDAKDNYLDLGNYYNFPHTVLEVHRFIYGKFHSLVVGY